MGINIKSYINLGNKLSNSKKSFLVYSSLIFASVFLIYGISLMPSILKSSSSDQSSQQLNFYETACFSTTGDFEGRKTPPGQGIDELIVCTNNVFYASGINATRDSLGGKGLFRANATTLQLCNATNGSACGLPVVGNTELYVPFPDTPCGLGKVNATYNTIQEAIAAKANWSISYTFTNTCATDQLTNVTRLLLADDLTNFSAFSFGIVNLTGGNNDKLTANISMEIS